ELLDIYVPDFQLLKHISTGGALGIRGIISDLDDKFLILLNGKVMNDKTIYGAIPERHMSMLDDIEFIEVISGSGSALYGPGAIGGVINIRTKQPDWEAKGSIKVRQGVLEEYSNLQLNYTFPINDDVNFSLYYGMDYYPGARAKDAPFTISANIPGIVPAGQVSNSLAQRSNQSYRGLPRNKVHLALSANNFESWLRFTAGGNNTQGGSIIWGLVGVAGDAITPHGYRQLTWMNQYTMEVNNSLTAQFNLSYRENNVHVDFGSLQSSFTYAEREILLRNLWQWRASSHHDIALGFEFSYDFFGRNLRYFQKDQFAIPRISKAWHTRTYSSFAEDQYRFTDDFRIISGIRIDKPDYSKLLLSPRLAFLWGLGTNSTLKLMLNRSVRKASEFDLRLSHNSGEVGDAETHDSAELLFEKNFTADLNASFTAYYYELEFITFSPVQRRSIPQGKLKSYGLQAKIKYHNDTDLMMFSHSFSKLLNLELKDPNFSQLISSEPYGYGDDFANWSNHMSKIYARKKLNKQFSVDTSLRVYWRFAGAEDMARYNEEVLGRNFLFPQTDGSDTAFSATYYWDLGASCELKSWTIRVDLHNFLGWVDNDYNNRIFFGLGVYRSPAESV
ncbi:MAG: TonB-dependent receptor plug domain-containing protein, partial [Lentisphaeraceae bacterium]|nr:TonB-dependent receptor plug domain-containing protein [Lentisphaeraceae bacterium]